MSSECSSCDGTCGQVVREGHSGDVQEEESWGPGESGEVRRKSEMEGGIRNSVRLYLRGWVQAPAGYQTERWCPQCSNSHPLLPACEPAGQTNHKQTQSKLKHIFQIIHTYNRSITETGMKNDCRPCTHSNLENKSHLCFDDSVHYCLQGLVPMALHNPLKVLWAVQESLSHCDVQIIVGLFSSQVLHTPTTLMKTEHRHMSTAKIKTLVYTIEISRT